jgi:hypothetical protein
MPRCREVLSLIVTIFWLQIGDFFLLYLIAKNVDEVTMKVIIIN